MDINEIIKMGEDFTAELAKKLAEENLWREYELAIRSIHIAANGGLLRTQIDSPRLQITTNRLLKNGYTMRENGNGTAMIYWD